MINQQQKDTLNSYAELKLDAKILEDKLEEMKGAVLEIMQSNELEEVELSTGKLSLGARRSWKYPEPIVAKEDELKAMKKEAEQRGTADYKENHYVLFKGFKE